MPRMGRVVLPNYPHHVVRRGHNRQAVSGLGQMMKSLAARATRYRNKLEGRSGTLWESRYKSSPVQMELYLLACIRYIELNPVRAASSFEPRADR